MSQCCDVSTTTSCTRSDISCSNHQSSSQAATASRAGGQASRQKVGRQAGEQQESDRRPEHTRAQSAHDTRQDTHGADGRQAGGRAVDGGAGRWQACGARSPVRVQPRPRRPRGPSAPAALPSRPRPQNCPLNQRCTSAGCRRPPPGNAQS